MIIFGIVLMQKKRKIQLQQFPSQIQKRNEQVGVNSTAQYYIRANIEQNKRENLNVVKVFACRVY